MNELEKSQEISFTSNGEGFISQVKLSELLGMARKTFNDNFLRLVANNPPAIKVNNNNQIHEDSLFDVVEFMAKRGTAKEETKNFFNKLKKLGSRALLIGVAGNPPASINQGLSPYDQMRMTADLLEAQAKAIESKAEQVQVTMIQNEVAQLEKSIRGNQSPRGYMPKHKIAIHFELPLNKVLLDVLDSVRSCRYAYSSMTGGIKYATAYCVEDVRVILES